MYPALVLKETTYPSIWTNRPVHLSYTILSGNRVVFSGIGNAKNGSTSTVNAAEDIIQLLCKIEQLNPWQCRFYDLQTHLMYGGGLLPPRPGEFMFDRLALERKSDGSFSIRAWLREDCPAEVIKLFSELIGPNPYQMQHGIDGRPNQK